MKIKNVLLIGFSSFFMLACSSSPEEHAKKNEDDTGMAWAEGITCPENWEQFVNEFISICFPKEWESDASGLMGSELVLKFVISDTLPDGREIHPNLNIMKQPVYELVELGVNNLDEFAEFNKKQLLNFLEDCEIQSFEHVQLSETDSYHIVLRATQMETLMYFDMYMVKSKKYYFSITFTASAAHADENLDSAREIIKTLRFS